MTVYTNNKSGILLDIDTQQVNSNFNLVSTKVSNYATSIGSIKTSSNVKNPYNDTLETVYLISDRRWYYQISYRSSIISNYQAIQQSKTWPYNRNDTIDTINSIIDSRTYYPVFSLNYSYISFVKVVENEVYFQQTRLNNIRTIDNNYINTRKINGVIQLSYSYNIGYKFYVDTYKTFSKKANSKNVFNNFKNLISLNQSILGYAITAGPTPFGALTTCNFTKIPQEVSQYTVKGNMNTEYSAVCKKIYVINSSGDLEHLILPNSIGYYNLYVPNNTDLYTFCFIPPFEYIDPKWYYNVNGAIQ